MHDLATFSNKRSLSRTLGRIGIYGFLLLFAIYYLMPLFVMLSTSLRSLAEIKTGSSIALPREITFDAWVKAWGQACIGTKCEGLSPHF